MILILYEIKFYAWFVRNPSVGINLILDRNEKVEYYIKIKDQLIYYLKIFYKEQCQSFI